MDIAEKGIITSAGMMAITLLAQGTPGYYELALDAYTKGKMRNELKKDKGC